MRTTGGQFLIGLSGGVAENRKCAPIEIGSVKKTGTFCLAEEVKRASPPMVLVEAIFTNWTHEEPQS
jgi:hypothetical protein